MKSRRLSDMRLKQILKEYLFVSKRSPMDSVINKIVAARTTKQSVELSGFAGSTMADVKRILSALEIPYNRATDKPRGDQNTPKGHEHRAANSIRIPHFIERPFDLEFLIPYYLQVFNSGFSDGDKDKVKKVDGLFIPYLYDHLSQFKDLELERFIRNAAQSAEDGTITIDSMRSATLTSLNDLRGHLMTLRGHAMTYLGLDYWFDSTEVPDKALDHPLNDFLAGFRAELQRQHEELAAARNWREMNLWGLPDFVVVNRVYLFDIADIGIAARNVAYWNELREAVGESVSKCLNLRNQEETETEIESALGFENSTSYQDWLTSNHLDIKSQTHSSVYERWLEAQEELFGGQVNDGSVDTSSVSHETLTMTIKGSNQLPSATMPNPSGDGVEVDDSKSGEDVQRELPVLAINLQTGQVWLDGEQVVLKPTQLNRFDALVHLLREQIKTRKPVPGFMIVQAAGAKKGTDVRDIFKAAEKINNLLESGPKGYWSLKVNLQKSKDQ